MATDPFVKDADAVHAVLEPFLQGNLPEWEGLPTLMAAALVTALGNPIQTEDVSLGWYPATRVVYKMNVPSGGFAAYIRNEEVVLVEALRPPAASVLQELEPPCVIKPHEIRRPNSYVHEYVFCKRGLVLSVAEPFEQGEPLEILRCRGLQPFGSAEDYGPEFYRAVEEQEVYTSSAD